MNVRILERLSTHSALGIRFWDEDFERPVEDAVIATARPWGQQNRRAVIAQRTFSGALVFPGLPGMRGFEHDGPPDANASPPSPPTQRFLIEVTDTKARYAPAAFGVDLPLPYDGPYLGAVLPSPAPPGFILIGGPDRPRDPSLARVTATLARAATGEPAAWARMIVVDPEGRSWHGIAGPDGRCSVQLPWPVLAEVVPGSPPTGDASSLLSRNWPLTIAVEAAAAPLPPITASEIPDYGQILSQPNAQIWPEPPDASPTPVPTPTTTATLHFGETLTLRSGARASRLFVGPGPSP
ncbi:hypothetical protein [Mameliella sp.]|uniref:hypothetical protein n=1 Tax=Mameliella sp. TaxID=1924940 RepID=UPI003BAD9EE0